MNQTKFARQTQKTFDSYNFAGYDWLVLEVQGKKALLLSKYVLERRAYHESSKDIAWEESDIRSYLNGEFYDSFTEQDKAQIVETQVINNDNPWFGTAGGNDTTDKVFLLSLEEVVKYFGDSGPGKEHQECSWWLRSPGIDNGDAANVRSDGFLRTHGRSMTLADCGVRPAMWINPEPPVPVCDECDKSTVSGDLTSAKDENGEEEDTMKNMKKFDVTITETLELVVRDIYANSAAEAEEIVRKQWKNAEHILDADTFVGVEFNAIAACTCTTCTCSQAHSSRECESGCGAS